MKSSIDLLLAFFRPTDKLRDWLPNSEGATGNDRCPEEQMVAIPGWPIAIAVRYDMDTAGRTFHFLNQMASKPVMAPKMPVSPAKSGIQISRLAFFSERTSARSSVIFSMVRCLTPVGPSSQASLP